MRGQRRRHRWCSIQEGTHTSRASLGSHLAFCHLNRVFLRVPSGRESLQKPGPLDEIIKGCMSGVTTLALPAAKTMETQVVYLRPTVLALVWMTQHMPRRIPIAILMVLLSILRPSEEIGGAFNQAPDSFLQAANKRPRDLSFGAFSKGTPSQLRSLGHPMISGEKKQAL